MSGVLFATMKGANSGVMVSLDDVGVPRKGSMAGLVSSGPPGSSR